MKPSPLRYLILIMLLSLMLPMNAQAANVLAGADLFQTDPNTTFQDFAGFPIPADFFSPGSDPFVDLVRLQGVPLGSSSICSNDDLNLADTIVLRLAEAVLPDENNSSDIIQVEIVELQLVSVSPIVVTENGGQNPTLWDIEVTLSDVAFQTAGTMTVRHESPAGGTFDSTVPVVPKFTFTQVGNPANFRVFDGGNEGLTIDFKTSDVPWNHHVPPGNSCTSNFCVNPDEVTVETALFAAHGVISICPEDPTPTDESTWGEVKSIYR